MKMTPISAKALAFLIVLSGMFANVQAAGGGIAWDKSPDRTNDLVALTNGAKLFVNYGLNCHCPSSPTCATTG